MARFLKQVDKQEWFFVRIPYSLFPTHLYLYPNTFFPLGPTEHDKGGLIIN
jgi:hypothetical protein